MTRDLRPITLRKVLMAPAGAAPPGGREALTNVAEAQRKPDAQLISLAFAIVLGSLSWAKSATRFRTSCRSPTRAFLKG